MAKPPDYRIAWSASLVNDTGDWVLAIALPAFVFIETGSGASTAVLFAIQIIVVTAVGPWAGSLVDRWDLRRVLVWTNLAQALTLLPLLAVTGETIWPAYVVMGVQAALTQFNNPANVSLIPRVVQPSDLGRANAGLSAAASIARLLGATLGGLLISGQGLGAVVVIVDALSFLAVAVVVVLVDAFIFLAVAVVVRRITSDTSAASPPGAQSGGRLRTGWMALRSHPPLARVVSLHGLAQMAQGAFVILFVAFFVDVLDDDGADIGLVRGSMAIGALVGAAIIGSVARRVDPSTLFALGLVGMGVISAAFWNAPIITTSLWIYVLLFALSGLPGAAWSVGLFTILQTRSPRDVLGRVVGLMTTGEGIGMAIGAIVTGVLIDRLPLAVLLDGQAAIYIVVGLLAVLLVVPHRSYRRPNGAPPVDGR